MSTRKRCASVPTATGGNSRSAPPRHTKAGRRPPAPPAKTCAAAPSMRPKAPAPADWTAAALVPVCAHAPLQAALPLPARVATTVRAVGPSLVARGHRVREYAAQCWVRARSPPANVRATAPSPRPPVLLAAAAKPPRSDHNGHSLRPNTSRTPGCGAK